METSYAGSQKPSCWPLPRSSLWALGRVLFVTGVLRWGSFSFHHFSLGDQTTCKSMVIFKNILINTALLGWWYFMTTRMMPLHLVFSKKRNWLKAKRIPHLGSETQMAVLPRIGLYKPWKKNIPFGDGKPCANRPWGTLFLDVYTFCSLFLLEYKFVTGTNR